MEGEGIGMKPTVLRPLDSGCTVAVPAAEEEEEEEEEDDEEEEEDGVPVPRLFMEEGR